MDENKKELIVLLKKQTLKYFLVLSFKGSIFLGAIWLRNKHSGVTKFEIQK